MLYVKEPLEEKYVEVPRFIGYGLESVDYFADLADVQIVITGLGTSGKAQTQSIDPGTKVKRGTVIKVSFVDSGGVETAGNTEDE